MFLLIFSQQSLQKEQDIQELKLTIVECSSVIEVWVGLGLACAGSAWPSQPLTKPHGCFRH